MAKSLADRISAYGPTYEKRWLAAKIDTGRETDVGRVVETLLANKARYDAVVAGTNVPWWMIGVTHYRESDCSFTRHPHNGDRLSARTVQVPAGRPAAGNPPFTWEESARDCYLILKRWQDVKRWDVRTSLGYLEAFNGFGYADYHPNDPSPYLWAATNQSDETGKYVADGRYDPNAPEKQLGVIALMLGLQAAGIDLWSKTSAAPAKAKPIPTDKQDNKTMTWGALIVATIIATAAWAVGHFAYFIAILAACGIAAAAAYFLLKSKGVLK